MKQNTKDWIQYGSAIALIASAIGVGVASVIITMDVGAGALTYIAEALSAAMGIFGVAAYAVSKIREIEDHVHQEVQRQLHPDETETKEVEP